MDELLQVFLQHVYNLKLAYVKVSDIPDEERELNFPEDLTELSSKELGQLMSKARFLSIYNSQNTYFLRAKVELLKTAIANKESQVTEHHLKAEPKIQITVLKKYFRADEDLRQLSDECDLAAMTLDAVKVAQDNLESSITSFSRELTRRGLEEASKD